jgi:hypothetical protein
MKAVRRTLPVLVLLLAACSTSSRSPPAPTPTPTPRLATVIDLSVEFAASEAAALRGRFLDLADLGRLDVGCQVEILTTTDRAARVRLVSCPEETTTGVERRAAIGAAGFRGQRSILSPERRPGCP